MFFKRDCGGNVIIASRPTWTLSWDKSYDRPFVWRNRTHGDQRGLYGTWAIGRLRLVRHPKTCESKSDPEVYCEPILPFTAHLVMHRDPANERRTLAIRNAECLCAWEKIRAHGEYIGAVPERWHRG